MLANFIAEFTPLEGGLGEIYDVVAQSWRAFVDGASNIRGAGIGIVIVSLEGVKLEHSLRLGFRALNNEVKNEALIAGLRAAHKLEATDVEMYSDSRLVVSQVEGSFEAKDSWMFEFKVCRSDDGKVSEGKSSPNLLRTE